MPGIDDNGQQVWYGVSHLDGKTPVALKLSPNGRITFDTVTTIAFDPALVAGEQTENDRPVVKATSSDDNTTVLPLVLNATTGEILAST